MDWIAVAVVLWLAWVADPSRNQLRVKVPQKAHWSQQYLADHCRHCPQCCFRDDEANP